MSSTLTRSSTRREQESGSGSTSGDTILPTIAGTPITSTYPNDIQSTSSVGVRSHWWSHPWRRTERQTRVSTDGMSESDRSSLSSTPSVMFTPPLSPSSSMAVPDWSQRAASANHSPAYSPLLFVILLFPLSTALVIGSIWTLPIRLPSADSEEPHSVFPKTIAEVRALAWALKGYSETGNAELVHVLAVLAVTALWKHAWSIPGSVLLNILTGTLLPPFFATLLQTLLTTLGSLLSTILATPLTPIIMRFFPSAIALTRSALEGPSSLPTSSQTTSIASDEPLFAPSSNASSITLVQPSLNNVYPPATAVTAYPDKAQQNKKNSSSPWARLSVLRLIGIVPWSGINVACGVCGVSLKHCAVGAFIGTLPWTAVTCQIGDILQTISSAPMSPNSPTGHQTISTILTSPETIFKLFILTFISLAPILAKERLSNWLNGVSGLEEEVKEVHEEAHEEEEERKGRRGHKKRFSVEWWRRSLSLSRTKDEEARKEEEIELLGGARA